VSGAAATGNGAAAERGSEAQAGALGNSECDATAVGTVEGGADSGWHSGGRG
jgi:hypothetical protein